MSKLKEKLINTYNQMSDAKVYAKGYLEGYRQCVVDIDEIEGEQPTINENQQIVLEWLKGRFKGGSSLFNAIQGFRGFNGVPAIELNALMSLSNNEESQVLQAFATWVLKQEEE